MTTSSPGFTSARKVAAIASVAPHVTVMSRSGSTSIPYQRRYFSAIASRSGGDPQVIAYWLMSPWIAAHAASFIGAGIGKSGNPCARLIASCWLAIRVISRMTLSVNVAVRWAIIADTLLDACVGRRDLPLRPHLRQCEPDEFRRRHAARPRVERHAHGFLRVHRR